MLSRQPHWRHGCIALVLALVVTGGLLVLLRLHWTGVTVLACWLAAVNLVAFGYFGWDKWCAVRAARRVPEVVLHGLSLAGGSPGALIAMRTFRHKTIKGPFRLAFWAIVLLQLTLAVWVGWMVWSSHH